MWVYYMVMLFRLPLKYKNENKQTAEQRAKKQQRNVIEIYVRKGVVTSRNVYKFENCMQMQQ